MVLDMKKAINTAIKREDYSRKLYLHMAKQADVVSVKNLCRRLAKEELGHKNALKTLDPKKLELKQKSKVLIGRTLVSTPVTELGGVRAMLTFAVDKEKKAEDQYKKLAKAVTNKKVKLLFTRLAAQENNHKRLLAAEYKKMF
ncbi:ferritin family protein [Candidatus Woesearchaeota archaeon]|nr:ferritin family protein [Candidatus Woesearchaeota archaeon]MBW3017107.1 ferritin family protein [Candidatus Woesearchaeota archaeon]